MYAWMFVFVCVIYYSCKVHWTIGILRTWNKYYYYYTARYFIWADLYTEVVFLYYCPSYPASAVQMYQATWAICLAIKQYSLSYMYPDCKWAVITTFTVLTKCVLKHFQNEDNGLSITGSTDCFKCFSVGDESMLTAAIMMGSADQGPACCSMCCDCK